MHSAQGKAEQIIFVLFLCILVGLPFFRVIPGWHWTFFTTVVFALVAAWASLQALHNSPVPATLRSHRGLLVFALAALGYLLLKSLPIWPEGVVALLSPNIREIFRIAGVDGWNASGLYALSIDAGLAMRELLRTAAYFAVMFLVLVLVNSPRRARIFAYALVLSVAVVGLWGIIDLFLLQGVRGRASGVFSNANLFAGFLELGIGLAVGLLYSQQQRLQYGSWRSRVVGVANWLLSWRALFVVLLLVMLAALFASASRGGNVSIVLGLAVASAALLRHQRSRTDAKRFFAGVMLLCVVTVSFIGADALLDRVGEGKINPGFRLTYGQSGMQMAADYPLFGMGGGSWRYAYSQYRGPEVSPQVMPFHAHNDHLQMLTEHGATGYLLFGAFILAALRVMVSTLQHRRDPFIRGVAFGALVATLSLLFHAFTDNNFQVTTNMAYFFAIIGLALAVARMPSARREGPVET